ncbi:caspase family protein [Fuscibacter oryzae]|uniref:Caspase family protein n=1 Tax=Fuscibacter oryzae TaxID=2803939 RepID=A0A8J7MU17_9RHOB|nr:caspase family protein [Fuscibacter oryzae]MBL4929591.1 caspase family protein [Fuscibacter oryzae]
MPAAVSGRIAKGLRLCAATMALCLGVGPALAERVALVVGNGDYTVAPDLKNPVGDATAVAAGLKKLGFTVTLLTDTGTAAFQEQMDSFVVGAEGAESVVFYYAGHAFQLSGVNYLVPVDAALDSRERLTSETWSLDAVIARLQSRNRQTLIFLDACRNDPLPQGVRGSGAATDGLARVQAGVGTFVAFATAPGAVSADGVAGADHSPFATALLKHLPEKGKSVSDMMIEVRNDVENATLRRQVPWDQSSLREQFYFVPPEAAAKQELSEADYELLAQLAPDEREQFLALLAKSGFDQGSLKLAEEEIALAEANLEQVAEETTILDSPTPEAPAVESPTEAKAPAVPDALVSLEDLQVTDESVAIGDAPVPDETVLAAIDPALKPDEVDGKAAIRLAALDWDSRKIELGGPTRLQGREVTADTPEGRDLLTAIDPRLLGQVAPMPLDLAKSVQGELLRVGCYRMAVDGNWGKGSRTALTSYYLAKHVVPTSLEPSADLFMALSGETKVVCEARVASSAVKTGKRAQVETAPVEKASVKSNVKTGKKQETAKTRITKGTIGITGSF